MTENEFILNDRIAKIKSIIDQYGIENFHMSFSGGKDSTVLSFLLDMAIPNNTIPRVYADTGIELNMVREFVFKKSNVDKRITIIKPSKNIREMLKENGYPFKSKHHSHIWEIFKNRGIDNSKSVKAYLRLMIPESGIIRYEAHLCPKKLEYQFYEKMPFDISSKCCDRLKKDPIKKWQKENNKPFAIIGIMASEGGQRETAKCLAFTGKKLKAFQPLAPVTKEWEEWFIREYNIEICDIYKPPYNFTRTGCKGCPFSIKLSEELKTLEKFFPEERKQCEIIWKPVYDEYRRINYRLKKEK